MVSSDGNSASASDGGVCCSKSETEDKIDNDKTDKDKSELIN